MKPPFTAPPAALAAAMLLAAAGCASAPAYRLHPGRAHKDLVICNVHLSEPLDVDRYSRIAEAELAGLLCRPVATPEEDLPLYEVRFEFLVARAGDGRLHKVATVRFNLLSPEALPQIILYPSVF